MAEAPMIRLSGVTKVFPGSASPAVEDLTLEVLAGELVTLVGPSGCGKTTTLKMINRIIDPSSGRIEVAGKDTMSVPPHELRRSIGYVIQDVGLFPHRTIFQNIATVPELLGWEHDRVVSRVIDLTETVGLEVGLLERYPAELSGGQQQRVGVARALAADPPVLLMDEPFGAVDPIVRAKLQEEFLTLQRSLGTTVVFVTHDIDEAVRMGTRVAVMNVGGVLAQFDAPERVLSEPASGFVADFLGGERGLKRLGLIPVSSMRLPRGPVVDIRDGGAEARRVMEEHGVDWIGLADGDRLLGWAFGHDVGESLDSVEPRPFLLALESSASLRQALDAVVTNRARVAVVEEAGRYCGMLDLELIAREVTE